MNTSMLVRMVGNDCTRLLNSRFRSSGMLTMTDSMTDDTQKMRFAIKNSAPTATTARMFSKIVIRNSFDDLNRNTLFKTDRVAPNRNVAVHVSAMTRSEERRVGKE